MMMYFADGTKRRAGRPAAAPKLAIPFLPRFSLLFGQAPPVLRDGKIGPAQGLGFGAARLLEHLFGPLTIIF